MKGFIEVTDNPTGEKYMVQINHIRSFMDGLLSFDKGEYAPVKETCDEIKALIEEATNPTFCNECPYSYDKTLDDALSTIGFEGTMDALNRLKIRKEDSPCTSEAETT